MWKLSTRYQYLSLTFKSILLHIYAWLVLKLIKVFFFIIVENDGDSDIKTNARKDF
jgi:hypothetical protein